jgi:hypothetical protein
MSHERCTRPDSNKGCIDCVAYGAMEEQSRIIKLLINTEEGNTAMGMAIYLGDNRGIIALIKGENNG